MEPEDKWKTRNESIEDLFCRNVRLLDCFLFDMADSLRRRGRAPRPFVLLYARFDNVDRFDDMRVIRRRLTLLSKTAAVISRYAYRLAVKFFLM